MLQSGFAILGQIYHAVDYDVRDHKKGFCNEPPLIHWHVKSKLSLPHMKPPGQYLQQHTKLQIKPWVMLCHFPL